MDSLMKQIMATERSSTRTSSAERVSNDPMNVMYDAFNVNVRALLDTIKQKYPQNKAKLFRDINDDMDEALRLGADVPYKMWRANCSAKMAQCMRKYSPENVSFFFEHVGDIAILARLNLKKYKVLFREDDLRVLWTQVVSLQQLVDSVDLMPPAVAQALIEATMRNPEALFRSVNGQECLDVEAISDLVNRQLSTREATDAMREWQQRQVDAPEDVPEQLKQLENLSFLQKFV